LHVIYSKEIEIKEDFIAEVDYRLETSNIKWRKRGVINFVQKNNNKNYKSSINVLNEQLTNEQIEEIKSECKMNNGLYYVRVKVNSNFYFAQVDSCELLKNNLYDRFIINQLGPIKKDNILSISYDVDPFNANRDKTEKKSEFISTAEVVNSLPSAGPTFPEEKEIQGKNGQPPAEQQSFLQKYWWVIMIVMFMMLIKGPTGEEGGSSASS